MNIRIVYMIVRSIKLVLKRMYWQCKSTISARLWRVGYRQVVLGRRKLFGCPKTQLANFVNFVDFSSARFVYMQASAHSLTRKIRLNINFQCLEIITHSLLLNSLISPLEMAGHMTVSDQQIMVSCSYYTDQPTDNMTNQ